MAILDSGNRREFTTGAVRDIADGKGRCDLLPLDIISKLFTVKENAIFTYINDYIRSGDKLCLYQTIDYFIENVLDTDIYTAMLEVAKHYEDGAKKYDERNWEKGINLHCYVDSGVRHYLKFLRGDTDERHDRAFLWNMLGALWTHEHKPGLIDLPFNEQKEAKTECKNRVWFGDYALHYCDLDNKICDDPKQCHRELKLDVETN